MRARIVEYYSQSQELSTKSNSQESISEISDEQKVEMSANKTSKKNEMDIESTQDEQKLCPNEQISRNSYQLGEHTQKINNFNGTNNLSKPEIQGNCREHCLVSNETMMSLETFATNNAN